MQKDNQGFLFHHGLLFIFTFFWGANFILAEIALKEMAPISFSVSRFAMGGVAMLSILYVQTHYDAAKKETAFTFLPRVQKEDWLRLLIISFAGATLAPWFGIEGLQLTHGARASLWLALGPAISTGIGYLLSTEKIGKYGYIGILLAASGTLTLAYDGLRTGHGYWMGDLLLCLALSMSVLELHLIKPLAYKYGSISMVSMRTLIGVSLYLIIASPSLASEAWLSFGFWTWFAILAGGCIGVGVGQWIKVRALRTLGPTRVVIYGNLVPIAAIIIAWLSIGENPSFSELIAGLLIITGAIFIQVIDALHTPVSKKSDKETLSLISGASKE